MKQIDKTAPNYLSNLEDKIVELGLKLKALESERTNLKKGELQLFKNFNHNLKNPLGIINSFSNMILENEENGCSKKTKNHINIIQNSSNFSLKLLAAFTEYYTLKNTHETLKTVNINLAEIILNEVEMLQHWALERNILIEIKAPKQPIYINSNENYLKKIIKALLHNAIRFSEDNSKVLIKLKQDSKTISIKIIDDGIGISEENLLKIYDEFFVCSTYAVDKTKCIGLGLCIAKTLIKNLNGSLQLKSELNKGTIALLSFKK